MTLLRSIFFVGIGLVVIALISGIRPSIEIGRQDTTNMPFVDRIDGPVRLTVVAADPQAFHVAVSAAASPGVVVQSADQTDLGSADAVVFLVNDWDEITNAPWQEALARDYERALGMAPDGFAISSTTIARSRPLLLTFYNMTHYSDWTMTCYAELFVHRLIEPEDASFAPSAGCPI